MSLRTSSSAASSKLHPRESHSRNWTNQFKQQCLRRFKDLRFLRNNLNRSGLQQVQIGVDDTVTQNHEDIQLLRQIIPSEWESFRHQLESNMPSIDDIEPDVLEAELLEEIRTESDPIYDQIMAYEEELQDAIDKYNNSLPFGSKEGFFVCYGCQTQNMVDVEGGWYCRECGLHIETAVTLAEMSQQISTLCTHHASTCHGQPIISYEPHTGMLMFCSQCDATQALL